MTHSVEQSVRFTPLPDAAMTPEQQRIAQSIRRGRKSLAGPFNAMLRSPHLADPLQQIGDYLRFRAPAADRLKEMAIIMVARFWSSEFEWHVHRVLAEKAGLSPAKVDAILLGSRPPDLHADEAAIYGFVGQLLHTGRVDDAAFAEARSRFGEEQVADLIGIAGYYCAVSFFLNVDRHPAPEGCTPMPPLSAAAFADAFGRA